LDVRKLYPLTNAEAKSPVATRARDACGKTFPAVVKAVDHLLVKYGYLEAESHDEEVEKARELTREIEKFLT